jgi:hypothetical protein
LSESAACNASPTCSPKSEHSAGANSNQSEYDVGGLGLFFGTRDLRVGRGLRGFLIRLAEVISITPLSGPPKLESSGEASGEISLSIRISEVL